MGLFRSVVATLAVFFLFQSSAFIVLWRFWLFPQVFLLSFFVAQIFFYLVVFFFLTKNSRLFYNTLNGENETKVNVVNKITLFRISMLPFLVMLTLVTKQHGDAGSSSGVVLTAVFALTFTTDFFDGRIARLKKLETYIGKILDSASDYLLLGFSAGAFFYFKLIKPWVFLIIIIRLFFNSVVMLILFWVHRKLRPQTTPLGKIAIAAIMVLLVLETAQIPRLSRWIIFIEAAAAFIIGISIIDKLVYLIKGLRTAQN